MVEPRAGRGEGISPTDGTGRAPGNWAARHDLVLFFALAYLLSWALWPLVILNPTSSPLVPFGPLIAAVVVSLLAGGPRELWALLRQLTRWRVHPMWYVIALLGPCVVAGVAAALAVATGASMQRSGAYTDLGAVGFTFLSTMIIVGLFEEDGWRGFALPRLQLRFDAIWAALVLGVLWALWHLPEPISDPTRQRPPLQFCVWVLALSVIFTWLYNDRYRGPVPASGVLQRWISGGVVVHGRDLRCDRDHRGTCCRPETASHKDRLRIRRRTACTTRLISAALIRALIVTAPNKITLPSHPGGRLAGEGISSDHGTVTRISKKVAPRLVFAPPNRSATNGKMAKIATSKR
jgi:membrane protease YdiL (CAAX protease family)